MPLSHGPPAAPPQFTASSRSGPSEKEPSSPQITPTFSSPPKSSPKPRRRIPMSFKQSFSALTLWSCLIVLGQSQHWLASRVARAAADYLDSTQLTLQLPLIPVSIDWLP